MAYAAVISLKQTIEGLVNNSTHISILPSSLQITEFACNELHSLQQVLKTLDTSTSYCDVRIDYLDGQIREVAHELEYVITSHVSNKFLSQYSEESLGEYDPKISLDIKELKQDFDSFVETVKEMKEEYLNEVCNTLRLPEQDDVAVVVPSGTDFCPNRSKMVGFSDLFSELWYRLLSYTDMPSCTFFSLFGMAGIGKTTLAKEIFEFPAIRDHFECRAWVSVGSRYQLKDMLQSILSQLNPHELDGMLMEGDDHKLALQLSASFKDRRSLIVLDDVWNSNVCFDLQELLLLQDDNNGSRVVLTTRILDIATICPVLAEMPFLNKEESWHLLRDKVFGEESSCPPQLERYGKKIADNCEGLPLTIVTVADILSRAEKTKEYWNEVAEKQNSVFVDAYDRMTEVLLPSYKYLSQHLKSCFLYIGVFPQKSEIACSKLINLLIAEGFLESNPSETLDDYAMKCLEELNSNTILMIQQRSSSPNMNIKTCGLHSVFWHLCIREARRTKFFHALNTYADGLADDIENQRRFCIYNNLIFSIKDVYDSVSSISTARSLLFTGPYHQFPVPICLDTELLRIVDALMVRLYEFPIEVLKLVQLTYLAFTYHGKLPASISKLWNLRWLIVNRHQSIIESSSCLPMEIWNMKQLKHIQVMGSDLPHIYPCEGSLLPDLLTLLGVSPQSCTKDVLERIPNLRNLGIRIDLPLDAADESESACCFDDVSHALGLETLKCIVVNPVLMSKVVGPTPRLPIFPSGLRKLTLSATGYPWKEMAKIASLPNLKVLKLRCYAFRGPRWETSGPGFESLEFLLVEDSDLRVWTLGAESFQRLNCVSFKHCYRLKELPRILSSSLLRIDAIDCNPFVASWAKQVRADNVMDEASYFPLAHVHCSWEDGK